MEPRDRRFETLTIDDLDGRPIYLRTGDGELGNIYNRWATLQGDTEITTNSDGTETISFTPYIDGISGVAMYGVSPFHQESYIVNICESEKPESPEKLSWEEMMFGKKD